MVLAVAVAVGLVGFHDALHELVPDDVTRREPRKSDALDVAQDADGNPLWRCSGTLLSSTLFLTAGHCTWFWSNTGDEELVIDEVWVTFDSEAAVDPETWIEEEVERIVSRGEQGLTVLLSKRGRGR